MPCEKVRSLIKKKSNYIRFYKAVENKHINEFDDAGQGTFLVKGRFTIVMCDLSSSWV